MSNMKHMKIAIFVLTVGILRATALIVNPEKIVYTQSHIQHPLTPIVN
jgi:hypothetical protein